MWEIKTIMRNKLHSDLHIVTFLTEKGFLNNQVIIFRIIQEVFGTHLVVHFCINLCFLLHNIMPRCPLIYTLKSRIRYNLFRSTHLSYFSYHPALFLNDFWNTISSSMLIPYSCLQMPIIKVSDDDRKNCDNEDQSCQETSCKRSRSNSTSETNLHEHKSHSTIPIHLSCLFIV